MMGFTALNSREDQGVSARTTAGSCTWEFHETRCVHPGCWDSGSALGSRVVRFGGP